VFDNVAKCGSLKPFGSWSKYLFSIRQKKQQQQNKTKQNKKSIRKAFVG